MSLHAAVLAAILLPAATAMAADIGSGFGENLWVLTSARQAGTGGLALEDPWRSGNLVEATSVMLSPELRWFGLAYQGGLGPALRAGVEGFMFSAPGIPRTTETEGGTFGGQSGTMDVTEWGGRVVGQVQLADTGGWRVGLLGRASGLTQDLGGEGKAGLALEAGVQGRRAIGGGQALTAWGLVGPIGRGASRWFSGQASGGVGLLGGMAQGLLGGAEGYGLGVEGNWLAEGLFHGGAGALYWFGRLDQPGMTFFLRGGVRYARMSAQEIQPRAGLGTLWRSESGWGAQFDYAFVPAGELGAYHYGTIGIRLPSARPREPAPASPAQSQAVSPEERTASMVMPAEIVFCPGRDEKARQEVDLGKPSPLSVTVLDGEGRTVVRKLVSESASDAGRRMVEWDGRDDNGQPVATGVRYLLRISIGLTTRDVTVVPTSCP